MIKHPWYNIFLLGFFGGCELKGKKLETGNLNPNPAIELKLLP